MTRVWAYFQFKNGSLAPLRPTDVMQLPEKIYVAWDRSLGAEVCYE